MSTIRRIDLTDVGDTLQGTQTTVFELISYDDGLLTTVQLAGGRAEEMGGQVYRVESGDYQVTDSGLANGVVYVHLKDNGDGTASAYLDLNEGTYDGNKGGYYHTDGAKVIHRMIKNGTAYNQRKRTPQRGREMDNPFNEREWWDKSYTFTGDKLTSMTAKDQALNSYTFTYVYLANDNIDYVQVVISGKTYKKTYSYDASDNLTDTVVTVT
jgi:hypothetical protein